MRFRLLFLALVAALTGRAADLTVQVQLRWRGEAIAVPSRDVTNASGQKLRLTRFAALISDVSLERKEGGAVQLDGQFAFLDAETNRLSFVLRNVPAGDYAGLSFHVGLPPATNHADPSAWPAGHPLNPVVNGLHWGWAGGYVFAALEGRYGAADAERGFSYHLATDARLMSVGFATELPVSSDTTVDLVLDLARVFGGRRLDATDGSESTHSGANDALAADLAKAFERSWFLLESRPTPAASSGQNPSSSLATPATGARATPRALTVPVGFPRPALPTDNPLTEEGIALGQLLFSTPALSANATQSCADCHQAERAFSDSRRVSPGAEGQPGTRNAPPLFNLAWSPQYGWDGAKTRVRDQVLAAILNPIEMHADPAIVLPALARDSAIADAFTAAFGTPDISLDRVGLALEQYLLTLVAAESKFDRAMRGAATLTAEEQQGFELFATEYDPVRGRRGADCFHCHGGALFTDFALRDNGLGASASDAGRATVTGRPTDQGKFKTPSLRNVAVTAPYMHDGRFETLEEVVAHYDRGVRRTPALDPNLAKHPDAGFALTDAEQRALIAFLRTLTDTPVVPAS